LEGEREHFDTMSLIASRHHVRPVYNTCVNSVGDNGTRTYEFLATEEELVASQYELSEVEALLLHLNDKKQLLLERIGRLNDAILLKHNRHHVHQYGASTVNPNIHANRAGSSRTNGRTWSEVVSGNPNQLLLDRYVQNTNTCTLCSTLYYSNVFISLNYIKIH